MQPASPTIPNHDKTTATVSLSQVQHRNDLNHDQSKYNTVSFISDPQSMTLKHVGENISENDDEQPIEIEPRETTVDHEAAAARITMDVFAPVTSTRGTCSWNELFRQLKIYRSLNGHCKVPQHHIQSGLKLGKWVSNQRQQLIKRQRGEYTFLTEERIKALDDLGFRWRLDRSRSTWEETVTHLAQFKRVHGHTNVPYRYDKRGAHKIKLGVWVRRQREEMSKLQRHKKSALTPKHIDDLKALGFVWKLGKSPKPKKQEEPSSNSFAEKIATNSQEEAQELLSQHAEAASDTTQTFHAESTHKGDCCNYSLMRPSVVDDRECCSFMRAPYPETVHHKSSYQSSLSSFSSEQQRLHSSNSLQACSLVDNRFLHSELFEEDTSRSPFSSLQCQPISFSVIDSLVGNNAFWSPVVPPSNFLEQRSIGGMTHSSGWLRSFLSQSLRRREDIEASFAVERGRLYLENVSNQYQMRNSQSVIAQIRLQERQDTPLLSSRLSGFLNY